MLSKTNQLSFGLSNHINLYDMVIEKDNFDVLDFTESKCVEKAKTVDMNYYIKNSEIPQFMEFLAKKKYV